MKFIQTLFDKNRKHFEKDGKLSFLYPFYDATETFFFIPGHSTRMDSPVRDSLDLKRYMSFVLLALMPPFLFGIYNAGFQSNLFSGKSLDFIPVVLCGIGLVLPIVLVSYLVGFFWETTFASIRNHPISEGFLVTGLLFPMTLPPTIPLWQVAIGISFGVVIGKEIFGGTGRNILNPALTGRAFLFFAYPGNMSGDPVWTAVSKAKEAVVDTVSSATPLAVSKLVESGDRIESALSNADYTFFTLLAGRYPGSIGATSALLCFMGACLLIFVGIASFRIVVGGVVGVLSMGLLLNLLAGDATTAWFSLNPLYHLVMGGVAFGLAYMATDPVSAPGMNGARWVYGFCIGALTVLIRVFNPAFPEGVMLAILFMNLFSPLFDYFTIKVRLKKRIVNV
ncbi:MAG: NADH:ubiquinone reductase (Na(+)-transporting) subunit B [Desulfobacterales bacterium]|nr:NADH:ubiquinone reductase (Na(+)-transporting) subunit B [Desulfobacterales bacterium]MDX2512202.1 NADH:ubiquinone reductase (Na(+)-transporting) subunit B [Desulfobacterales bacterium]